MNANGFGFGWTVLASTAVPQRPRALSVAALGSLLAWTTALTSFAMDDAAEYKWSPPSAPSIDPVESLPAPAWSARPSDPPILQTADQLVRQGDLDGAIQLLDQFLAQDARSAAVWHAIALLEWRRGRPDRAEERWRVRLAVVGDEIETLRWLARLQLARNRLQEARELYQRICSHSPDDLDARFQIARLDRWLGNLPDAIALLRELCSQHPERPEYRRELATALYAHRQYKEAAALWKEVEQAFPSDENVQIRSALAQVRASGDPKAIEQIRGYLERTPTGSVTRIMALEVLTMVARRAGRFEEAARYARQRMECETDPERRRRWLFRTVELLQQAKSAGCGPLEEAARLMAESLKDHSWDVDQRLARAEILLELKRYDEAVAEFLEVLQRWNPSNLRATLGLFNAAVARQQWKEARQWLDRIESFNPKNPYWAHLQCRYHLARGAIAEASRAADRLIETGRQGAVAVLLYHGLTESEAEEILSVQQFQEQLQALQRAGYRFVAAHQLPDVLATISESSDSGSPPQIACVTFDDARADALRLGTPVARSLGITLTMMVPVGLVEARHPFLGDWDMIASLAREKTWVFGLHGLNSHTFALIDEKGSRGHPLCNRCWIPDQKRLETLEEFHQRLREEYRTSRQRLVEQLRMVSAASTFAYPFGDIGQLGNSNVENAPAENLHCMAQYYRVGFIQSAYGHAVASDDPRLYQRTEPSIDETAEQLVDRLWSNHPTVLGWRLKFEVALASERVYGAREAWNN